MSNKTKIWLVTAFFLVVVGCIIFVSVMSAFKWDFTKLSTLKYETNDYNINEEYKKISIITDTADIVFLPSENEVTTVICREYENVNHLVKVKDNTLVIEIVDMRKWYEHIGINFVSQKITVYLPTDKYTSLYIKESTGDIEIPKDFKFENVDILLSTGDVKLFASASETVKVKTSTGNITAENISAGNLNFSTSTGKIEALNVECQGDTNINVSTGKTVLGNVKCKNLTTKGSTGNIVLENVIAEERFSIERSTGDVSFDGSDASEIYVKTDTGDVVGSLLTEKVFITETDTGYVNVPKSVTGGRCEITSDTGDIKITIQ